MKKIKPVVLKDATKLTNSEMKKIRGGIEPEYSQTCSAVCYTSTGAMLGSFEKECDNGYYCDLVSGAVPTALACFDIYEYNNAAPTPYLKEDCSTVFENYI